MPPKPKKNIKAKKPEKEIMPEPEIKNKKPSTTPETKRKIATKNEYVKIFLSKQLTVISTKLFLGVK